MGGLSQILPVVGGIIAAIIVLIIILSGYVKASPDTAYIISGIRKKPKVLIGRAGIKIPFLEKKDEVVLALIPVDIKLQQSVPTADYINITVDAIVNIKVDKSKIDLASQNFLNRDCNYIANVAQSVLEGNTREIIGKMKLEEMVSNREKFSEEVTKNAVPNLGNMGLEIVSYNVQNFADREGVINNLGIDNIVKIQKGAAIARAESERDIKKAQADAEKEAKEAQVNASTAMAEMDNQLAIKKAELKKQADIKQADADKAYEIQAETQRKIVEVTRAEANIAAEEQQILLRQKSVAVKEQELQANIVKQAEATKIQAEKNADAMLYRSQKDAEAELYKKVKDAEANKVEADAELYRKEKEAEAVKVSLVKEAEGIKAKGLAEAEAIKAKGLAEAEAIQKKAEAMQQYGEAAILEMFFKAFPEAVKNAAEPLGNVDNITMYGSGNNEQLVGSILKTVTQVNDGIKGSTGIDLPSLLAGFAGGKVFGGSNQTTPNTIVVNPVENKGSEETNND